MATISADELVKTREDLVSELNIAETEVDFLTDEIKRLEHALVFAKQRRKNASLKICEMEIQFGSEAFWHEKGGEG